MKFSILQENLKKALLAVNNITSKQVNLPILNGVLIKAQKQGIKILATNLEIGIVYGVRGKVEEEGEVVVEAKTLVNLISLLPNQKINFEKKEKKLIIKTDNYLTKINYQVSEEFPIIPEIKNNNEYRIGCDDFYQALNQVLFAVSSDDTKVELSGVLVKFNKKELIFVGTDGFRLAEKKILLQVKQDSHDLNVIIPARTGQEVLRVISLFNNEDESNNSEIVVQVNDNQIQFLIGQVRIISRLIEGKFPNYKQIIPASYKTKCRVDKKELIQAIKASALFSKEKIDDINLKISKNNLIISSSSQTGESVVKVKVSSLEGEENQLSLNYRYFLDGLNNIPTSQVIIELIDNNTPCVLKPENKKDYVYLIMPLKQ